MRRLFAIAFVAALALLLWWVQRPAASPAGDAGAHAPHLPTADNTQPVSAEPLLRIAVVLTDAADAALPFVLQQLVGARVALRSKGAPASGAGLRLGERFVRLAAGDYTVHVFYGGRATGQSVGACRVAPGASELRLAVPDPGRAVHLSLRGLDTADYTLQLMHESGHAERIEGRADHEHTLLLPPGPFALTLERSLADGRRTRHERVFTVGEPIEQSMVWQVLVPR